MAINPAQIVGAFNKAGYRLASKVTGQVVKNMPEGAVSMSKCVVEHVSGKSKTIYSFLNADGKAVQIQTLPNYSNKAKITNYNWIEPKTRTLDTAMWREKVDPYAFENHGVSYNTKIIDRRFRNVYSSSDTTVDINIPSRTVTKSFASRITPTSIEADGFTDTARLTQIVNGKKTKEICQKSTGKANELNSITETTGFGVTEQELEQATSNPYFYAMFKNPVEMAKSAKTRAFANQGIPQDTPLSITKLKGYGGEYSPTINEIRINLNSLRQGWHRSMVASTLEHEARHKWQHQLVQKLDKGLLSEPQEIAMAKEFKNNFENYIDKSKGYKAYETQPLEADAYRTTDIVAENYSKSVDYLQTLFPRSARRTLGE